MGNMSYCRFENTSGDLYDCIEAMEDVLQGNRRTLSLNQYEVPAFHRLAKHCARYLELYEELATDTAKLLPNFDYDVDDNGGEEDDDTKW